MPLMCMEGAILPFKYPKELFEGGFRQNELILEFPTKSMQSGFPRRGSPGSFDRFFRLGSVSLPGLTGQAETGPSTVGLLRGPRFQMVAAPLVKLLLRITHG